MAEIKAADILAAADVLHAINEQWDQLTIEQTVDLLAAAQQLQVELRSLLSNLGQHAISRLEQPVEIDGKNYSKHRDMKQRPKHRMIRDKVVEIAAGPDKTTGEVLDREAAVQLAVKLMADMYVAPTTLPKIGGLRQLGFVSLADVCEEEFVKWTLDIADADDSPPPATEYGEQYE